MLNKLKAKIKQLLKDILAPSVTYTWDGKDYHKLEELPKHAQEKFIKLKKLMDEFNDL